MVTFPAGRENLLLQQVIKACSYLLVRAATLVYHTLHKIARIFLRKLKPSERTSNHVLPPLGGGKMGAHTILIPAKVRPVSTISISLHALERPVK